MQPIDLTQRRDLRAVLQIVERGACPVIGGQVLARQHCDDFRVAMRIATPHELQMLGAAVGHAQFVARLRNIFTCRSARSARFG